MMNWDKVRHELPLNAQFGRIVFVVTCVCTLVSLFGVALGVFNYVQSAHYPAYIVAIWFLANILLWIIAEAHMTLLLFLLWGSENDVASVMLPIGMIAYGMSDIAMLSTGSLGWSSMLALVLFCIALIATLVIWYSAFFASCDGLHKEEEA